MNPLVVIPARGGSKGIPGKNIKLLNNLPLIHYTIASAREVFEDKFIYVSTDDVKIKECAEQTGLPVPFIRPSHLATDSSGTYEVLLHAVQFAESQGYSPDILILLQPTSPFRTGKHIREALQIFKSSDDMIVSVKETRSNPYYVLFEDQEDGYLKKSKEGSFVRRQDCPQVWEYNGAIYIINVSSLKKLPIHKFRKVRKYVMDDRSSHDIDTIMDWRIAEMLAKE